jgi:hypothetical protein
MATSSRSRVAGAIVAVLAVASAAAFAACGSSTTTEEVSSFADAPAQMRPQAFGWLHPAAPPTSWHTSTLPNGKAQLGFPGSWHSIVSDPGTRSAAIHSHGHGGRIVGYLNATPQQGDETLANWSSFRLDHNEEEGDTAEKLVAAAHDLTFRDGHGSCVIDDYRSSSNHRYREIACIVAGANATTVVVGAAPPQDWHSQSQALERAISAFKT